MEKCAFMNRNKRKRGWRCCARIPATALLLCGVAMSRLPEAEASNRDQLVALHVVTLDRMQAGFAARERYVITRAGAEELYPVAVVDGLPVERVSRERATDGATRSALPLGDSLGPPWGLLRHRLLNFGRNQLDPSGSLRSGDAVLLGGFFLPTSGLTAKEFVNIPRSVVDATVLGAAGEAVFVLAPRGNYRGFVGGPAAYKTGEVRVWGMICGVLSLGPFRACDILVVARLPSELADRVEPGDL